MIWEEIDRDLIDLNVEANDKNDILRHMGKLLIEQGLAKPGYPQALIDRERDNPTGIDMSGFGIAIPHTDASFVKKSGIGIGILRNSVKFMAMGTDDEFVDVKLVFVLAINNPKAHLERIQALLTVLQDAKVLDEIWNSKSQVEIINIIKNKESLT